MGNMVTFGEYTANQSGDVMGHRKGESIKDYHDLANAMSMGKNSNYPVGLSACFVAGINGDWEDDGLCPISKIDWDECTCDEEFKAPKEP